MKRIYLLFGLPSLALLLFLFPAGSVQGCNLTDLTLNSVTPGPGSNTTIVMTGCYGYGRTGAAKGADNDTRSVGFGWYSTDPLFSVVSFDPATMVGTFSGCTMPGYNLGPAGPPYNSQGTVLYVDPGYYGLPPCVTQPYGCVTSTAQCGDIGQQCVTYTFVVSGAPDSVRIFGAEGGGNPVAGCYPNADMMIDFTTLPARWGEISAKQSGNVMNVSWSTLQEMNTDFFIVERSAGDGNYVGIGTVQAYGNASAPKHYNFVDEHPLIGEQQYRLVLVDRDGKSSTSEAVSAYFDQAGQLTWVAVGPVPTRGMLNLTFANTDKHQTLQLKVAAIDGKVIVNQEIHAQIGLNSIALDLGAVLDGVYFVSLKGDAKSLSYKVVKQ